MGQNSPIFYGNNLSDDFGGPICIPWGFQVETLSEFHFVVSCLNVSLGIGVYDLHVEVRDGKIIQAKNPDIWSPKYDIDKGCHRVSVFLQRDPHEIYRNRVLNKKGRTSQGSQESKAPILLDFRPFVVITL